MAPTPIAFGITDLDVGGAERTLVELTVRLDRSRWSPSVVCLQPCGRLADRLAEAGIPVETLGACRWRQAFAAVEKWSRLLRSIRPALLQTFLFHANFLGRFAAKRAGVPFVLSGLRVAERRRNGHVELDRWTRCLVDRYVCVSRGVAEFAANRLKVDQTRIAVIPNGVDCAAADQANPRSRAELGFNDGDLVLLYVGRLDPQKGVADLLEAAAIRRRRSGPDRLRLVLVGDGPMRAALEREAKDRGLADAARFVGHQPDPLSWMAMADGLVLPSHWEGMPNVVLEAMASRRPVIATDVEGTRELIIHGQNGWLPPPGKPAELAAAIDDFVQSTQRRAMGLAGRRLVERHYSYDAMVESYQSLYERLLREPKAGRV